MPADIILDTNAIRLMDGDTTVDEALRIEYQGICVLDVDQHPEITVPGQLHWICLNNDTGGNDNIIVAHQGVIDSSEQGLV